MEVKLAKAGAVQNAFVFDEERLSNVKTIATNAGLGSEVALLLDGKPFVPTVAVIEENKNTGLTAVINLPASAVPKDVEAFPMVSSSLDNLNNGLTASSQNSQETVSASESKMPDKAESIDKSIPSEFARLPPAAAVAKDLAKTPAVNQAVLMTQPTMMPDNNAPKNDADKVSINTNAN